MNSSNGNEKNRGWSLYPPRPPSTMGTWRRFFWMHRMNPEGAVQEGDSHCDSPSSQEDGQVMFGVEIAPTRSIALSPEEEAAEGEKEVDVLKKSVD